MFIIKSTGQVKDVDTTDISIKVLRNAQYSGTLSLSNRGLNCVPDVVWRLNTPLPPAESTINFEASGDDTRWWETQPIERLTLSYNKISNLDGLGLANLYTLTYLDVRDNLIAEIPDEIESLTKLKHINLSCNRLTKLPSTFHNLNNLVWLDVSHNALTEIPCKIGQILTLERLDFCDCKLTSLPDRLPAKLGHLDVSKNMLTELPNGLLQSLHNLREFNASDNQLQSVGMSELGQIKQSICALVVLYLHKNKLFEFPNLNSFTNLKEVTLSDNKLRGIQLACLERCSSLATLDVARNNINELPMGIPNTLPQLARLDLSNNNLLSIPTDLGFLESLNVLNLTANPLRSISHSVISSGTQGIKALLQSRHVHEKPRADSAFSQQNPDHQILLKETIVSDPLISDSLEKVGNSNVVDDVYLGLAPVAPSGTLDWSVAVKPLGLRGRLAEIQSIPRLPPLDDFVMWHKLAMKGVSTGVVKDVRLSCRQLAAFPLGLSAFANSVTSIYISRNNLNELPKEIGQFTYLELFDVSLNNLKTIDENLTTLARLHTLILDGNALLGPELPTSLFQGSLAMCLQHLSVRSCKLKRLPPASLLYSDNMPALNSFDVSDNDIDALQPELGLCSQLKSLRLEGNPFRVPRPAIVAKGTNAVLDYLRSRIVS